MLPPAAVNRSWLCSGLLTLLGILGFPPGVLRGDDAKSIEEIRAINSQWDEAVIKAALARRKTKSPIELEQVQDGLSASEHRLVERCMDLASRQPDSTVGLIALRTVACRSPRTEEGKEAARILLRRAASVELDVLAKVLDFSMNDGSDELLAPLMPIILERVKGDRAHPQAARLLVEVISGSAGREAMKPPAEFVEAAELIVERYSDSPHVRGLCELLGSLSESRTWPLVFEKHLRTILARNQDRAVRAAASYSLASVVALAGEGRQGEAEKLYEEAIEKYDGNQQYFYSAIEKQLNEQSRYKLAELKSIGKPAPEIEGIDLDGHGMKLSDYRGKVVLVSFWATWCGPCMKMIPHERELVKRLEGKPFVIVGVNGDDDRQAARDAAVQHRVTWRSFRDKHGGRTISLAWHVWGWPTFYLIDQDGIIRKRWNDAQPEALDQAIDQLIGVPTGSRSAK